MDCDGNKLWDDNGVVVCIEDDFRWNVDMISTSDGGVVLAWEDYRNLPVTGKDIYAQRLDPQGNCLWQKNGVDVSVIQYDDSAPKLATDGLNGAIVVWVQQTISHFTIHAQRLDSNGISLWNAPTYHGILVGNCTVNHNPQVASDNNNGAVIVWATENGLSNQLDIKAQRIDMNGRLLWNQTGVVICNAENDQYEPAIVACGNNNSIICWMDYRSQYCGIYAQMLSNTGITQWTENGIAVNRTQYPFSNLKMTNDGNFGTIISWDENRNPSLSARDIYSQRINASGEQQWAENGVVISNASFDQEYPQIAPDNMGGAVIVWRDARNGLGVLYDVYAPEGFQQWATLGTSEHSDIYQHLELWS